MGTNRMVHSALLVNEIPFADQLRSTVPSRTFDPSRRPSPLYIARVMQYYLNLIIYRFNAFDFLQDLLCPYFV